VYVTGCNLEKCVFEKVVEVTSQVLFMCKYTAFPEACEIERFQTAKVTFNVTFHCNYVSILHRFRDIITYFPKFKEVT